MVDPIEVKGSSIFVCSFARSRESLLNVCKRINARRPLIQANFCSVTSIEVLARLGNHLFLYLVPEREFQVLLVCPGIELILDLGGGERRWRYALRQGGRGKTVCLDSA